MCQTRLNEKELSKSQIGSVFCLILKGMLPLQFFLLASFICPAGIISWNTNFILNLVYGTNFDDLQHLLTSKKCLNLESLSTVFLKEAVLQSPTLGNTAVTIMTVLIRQRNKKMKSITTTITESSVLIRFHYFDHCVT